MDGNELLTYARKNKPDTAVAVMTADYCPEVERRLLPLGASKCFEKPFSFRDMAAWIVGTFMPDAPHPLPRMPLSGLALPH